MCVVFISRFDIFNDGHPIYHVDRVVRETRRVVDNGFEEIYVNAAVNDGSDVAELMDVFVGEGYNDKFPFTSAGKYRYKETEEGQEIMCDIVEKFREEAHAVGRAEGLKEGELKSLISLVNDGLLDISIAAERSGMSMDEFSKVCKER